MAPQTMTETTAGAAMQTIQDWITPGTKATDARRRMEELDVAFMVVVAEENDELLGVVLRGVLERGCEANGHAPRECPVTRHLKADVDVCFADDPVEEALEAGEADAQDMSALARRRRRVRRSLPVIVVDERRVPLGLLARDAA